MEEAKRKVIYTNSHINFFSCFAGFLFFLGSLLFDKGFDFGLGVSGVKSVGFGISFKKKIIIQNVIKCPIGFLTNTVLTLIMAV
jgi:hypothetical protein